MLPFKMCGFVRYMLAPNIKCPSPLDKKLWPMFKWIMYFYLWLWRMTLTFYWYHSEYAALWDFTCTLNIKCLSLLDQKLWPKLLIWPLTLKNDLDLKMLPLKMCGFVRYMCTPNTKCLSQLDQKLWPIIKWIILPVFWPLTLKDDRDLEKLHSKCATGRDAHAYEILSLYL